MEKPGYLWLLMLCRGCGGGSSKAPGRFEAADLLAVKLDDGAPRGSGPPCIGREGATMAARMAVAREEMPGEARQDTGEEGEEGERERECV